MNNVMMCPNRHTKQEFGNVSIIQKSAALALIIAVAGNAGGQTSKHSGMAMHSGPVMNYHRIDERLVTGGHLVGNGVQTLQAEGVTVVIDLRDGPPADEKKQYAEYGIEWINVPVVWKDPRSADFTRFRQIMQAHEDEHVFVQCAANYRASAFTYLYRVVVSKVDDEKAIGDLYAVWKPKDENEQWHRYIEDIKASTR